MTRAMGRLVGARPIVRLLMRRTIPGKKKTKRRRRRFLFIVIQFFIKRAATFEYDGRVKVVFGFLWGDFFISLVFKVSDSFWPIVILCKLGVFVLNL